MKERNAIGPQNDWTVDRHGALLEQLLRTAHRLADEPGHEPHVVALMRCYLRFCPSRAKGWYLYGEALRVLGRRDEALAALQHAWDEAPPEAEGYIAVGMAMLLEKQFSRVEAKRWYEVASDAIAPALGWTWILRGANLAALNEFHEAIHCFEAVVVEELDDRDEALFNLGVVYRALRDYERAGDYFQQALAERPDYAEAAGALAGLQGMAETLTLAASLEKTASPQEVYRLAWREFKQPEREAHVAELMHAYLRLHPGHDEGWCLYGAALRRLGRKNEALAALQRAFELASPQGSGYVAIEMAKLLTDHDLPSEACKWFERATEAFGTSKTWAWVLRGCNAAVLNDFAEAIRCQQMAVDSEALEKDEALLNLGYVYRAMENYPQAMACFQRALEVCADYPEARQALAGLQGLAETLELVSGTEAALSG